MSVGEIWFVSGGARSGKSRFAERLARETGRPLVYLVTMVASDEELVARIAAHRRDRPADARTIEAPRDPAGELAAVDGASCVLLDCLSLWVSNRLIELGEAPSLDAVAALDAELQSEAERWSRSPPRARARRSSSRTRWARAWCRSTRSDATTAICWAG